MRIYTLLLSVLLAGCLPVVAQTQPSLSEPSTQVNPATVKQFAKEFQRVSSLTCTDTFCVSEVGMEATVDGETILLTIRLEQSKTSDSGSKLTFSFQSASQGWLMIEDSGLDGIVDRYFVLQSSRDSSQRTLTMLSCFDTGDPKNCVGVSDAFTADAKNNFYGYLIQRFLTVLKTVRTKSIVT